MHKLLFTANSLIEADLLAARLRAHGIEAQVPDRHTAGNQPFLTPVLGGVRVTVAEADFQEALRVLNEPEPSDSQIVAEELVNFEPNSEPCPLCESTNVVANSPSHTLADSVLSLGLGALFVVRRRRLRCKQCNNVWRSKQASQAAKIAEVVLFIVGMGLAGFAIYTLMSTK